GIDIITDFTDGQDLIGLKAGLIFAELSIAQVGNDTVLTSVRGLSITLQWVNISAIGETDFIIV
ncbi:MAG: hypothetical protein WBF52_18550, partial [Geitlerinemataceae cyanobacterium]